MPICVQCGWCQDFKDGTDATCMNPDLPLTDYVYGIRLCNKLNSDGNCKGFKPQSDESIYELKEDQVMASVHKKEHNEWTDTPPNECCCGKISRNLSCPMHGINSENYII